MNCIVCKKHLDSIDNEEDSLPMKAVAFTSYGNYGSQVFDPMDFSYLEIYVCDDCVVKAKEENQIFIGYSITKRNLQTWK